MSSETDESKDVKSNIVGTLKIPILFKSSSSLPPTFVQQHHVKCVLPLERHYITEAWFVVKLGTELISSRRFYKYMLPTKRIKIADSAQNSISDR
uniref:tRNA-synt_1 domain-containing protein n=1 Tax=Heterorhabditis bacteriophora TaxID=37862 RepID=A0A1I7XAP9_HETBA